MEKKYQVFVSSTYIDLKDERSGVIQAILALNCIPVGMEQFPAAPISQWDYIMRLIDESDYIVLIIAGRYGTEDKTEKISFTEKEFNYAKDIGKPILAFLIQDPDNLVVSKCEKTDSKKEKLASFRSRIETSGYLVNYYSNVDDLKYKVATSISACIKDNPGIGWVRADQIEALVKEINADSKQFSQIKEKMLPQYHAATNKEIDEQFGGRVGTEDNSDVRERFPSKPALKRHRKGRKSESK